MKIAHLLGWYYPESIGGTEVYVAALASRMRNSGHLVTVVAPLQGANGSRAYQHEDIDVFRFPTPVDATRDECQGRASVRGSEHLHDWLQAERPDIAHFHTLTTGLGIEALKAAREAGAKIVVTNHLASIGYLCQRGTMMHWGKRQCDGLVRPAKCAACSLNERGLAAPVAIALASLGSVLPSSRRSIGRIGTALGMAELVRHNLRRQQALLQECDKFVLLNAWALEAARTNGASREKLVLNRLGSSFSASSYAERDLPIERPLRIGFFGRLVGIKGVWEMIRAVEALPRELRIEIEFRGPTGGDEGLAIRSRLNSLSHRDSRVTVSDPVPIAMAPQILASYDVLCCPSIWFENGPTVALEAMAVGTPVIGTNIGAMPEMIEDGINGRLLEPGDWRSLRDAFVTVASDNGATIRRWRSALPNVRTMDDVAADYMTLYADL